MTLFFIRIQGYIATLFNEILSQNTKERERDGGSFSTKKDAIHSKNKIILCENAQLDFLANVWFVHHP